MNLICPFLILGMDGHPPPWIILLATSIHLCFSGFKKSGRITQPSVVRKISKINFMCRVKTFPLASREILIFHLLKLIQAHHSKGNVTLVRKNLYSNKSPNSKYETKENWTHQNLSLSRNAAHPSSDGILEKEDFFRFHPKWKGWRPTDGRKIKSSWRCWRASNKRMRSMLDQLTDWRNQMYTFASMTQSTPTIETRITWQN